MKKLISVVIPAFNEERNIPLLVKKINDILCDHNAEIVVIDDGSSDRSLNVIKTLSSAYENVQYVSFSRNFGHQNALKAGFDVATGDCVITLDADFQHPPQLLLNMISKWEEGYPVVQMVREADEGATLLKRVSSHIFYRFLNAVSGIELVPGSADFRLLDRTVVDICKGLSEDSFFWRGLISWLGFKTAYIEYTAPARLHGESKYTIAKMFKLATLGITSFSLTPLRIVSYVGAFLLLFSLVYISHALYVSASGVALSGWTSQIFTTLLFGGVQMVSIGVLGEYIGKIHMNSKKRPSYIVKDSSYGN